MLSIYCQPPGAMSATANNYNTVTHSLLEFVPREVAELVVSQGERRSVVGGVVRVDKLAKRPRFADRAYEVGRARSGASPFDHGEQTVESYSTTEQTCHTERPFHAREDGRGADEHQRVIIIQDDSQKRIRDTCAASRATIQGNCGCCCPRSPIGFPAARLTRGPSE